MTSKGFGWTEKGPFRSQNQDAFYLDDSLGLYLVCDGMGGHADGKVAAELTVECVVSYCNSYRNTILAAKDKTQPERILIDVLKNAVRRSASSVYEMGSMYEQCEGMGTTLTALLLSENVACVIHVGDSRCYRFTSDGLEQLTKDHTLAQDLMDSGSMSEEELAKAPFANALSKSIGQEPEVSPDIIVERVDPGDRFLLTTDGLNANKIGMKSLRSILDEDEASDIARTLSRKAIESGSKDNVTALLVEVEEKLFESPRSSWRAVA